MDSIHLSPVTPRRAATLSRALAVGLAAVVVIAVVGVGGAALLGRGGNGPFAGGVVAPAVTPSPTPTPVPTPAPVRVTGSSYTADWQSDGTSTEVGKVTQVRDAAFTAGTFSSDPRLAGDTAVHLNMDVQQDGSATMWGTETLTGPAGTWKGSFVGLIEKGYATHRMAAVLEGTGTYQGLQYRYTQTSTDGTNFFSTGVIEAVPAQKAVSVAGSVGITGTSACGALSGGTTATVGGVSQRRDAVAMCGYEASDPRVVGEATSHENGDIAGDGAGSLWGTIELSTGEGTWTGAWTGTVDASGSRQITTVWIGSGGYLGLWYRTQAVGGASNRALTVTGAIAPLD